MRGVPIELIQLSTEVIETTRAMVREGIDLDTFMRGYQVGAAYWWELWADAVERHCSDLTLAFQIMNRGTAFLFEWLQMMTDRISAEYYDEAERLARAGSLARLAAVQRTLTDDNVDVVAASQRLGYELRGNHVALVLSREDGSEAALTGTARALAGMMTSTRPLIVPVDADTVWCWVPADAAHELTKLLAAVRCGQGRPGKGLDGFRRTHREAREALRVAQIAGSPAPTFTRFAHVELAALCSVDPDAVSRLRGKRARPARRRHAGGTAAARDAASLLRRRQQLSRNGCPPRASSQHNPVPVDSGRGAAGSKHRRTSATPGIGAASCRAAQSANAASRDDADR